MQKLKRKSFLFSKTQTSQSKKSPTWKIKKLYSQCIILWMLQPNSAHLMNFKLLLKTIFNFWDLLFSHCLIGWKHMSHLLGSFIPVLKLKTINLALWEDYSKVEPIGHSEEESKIWNLWPHWLLGKSDWFEVSLCNIYNTKKANGLKSYPLWIFNTPLQNFQPSTI